MVADGTDLLLIRYAIADTDEASQSFTDETLQIFWANAEAIFPSGDVFILREQTIVTALDAIMADASKLVTYKQNSQSENMSDVFKHLRILKAEHVDEVVALSRRNKPATRMAVIKIVPTVIKEYPNS